MINPMIAMTTSISTRVKPASARRSARRPPDIAKRLIALSHLRDCQIAHRRSARGCHAQDFGRRGHPDPAFSMASSNIVVMPARMAARSMTVASAPAPFEQVQTKLLYRTLWHRSRRTLRCREPSTAWHRHVLLCSAASRICWFEIKHHAGLDLGRMSLLDVGLEFPLPHGFLDVSPLCRGSTYHVNVLHTAVRRHDHAHWNRYGLRTDTFGLHPAHNILGSIVLETFRNRIGHLIFPSRTETVQ